jgi:hypothetical protein
MTPPSWSVLSQPEGSAQHLIDLIQFRLHLLALKLLLFLAGAENA